MIGFGGRLNIRGEREVGIKNNVNIFFLSCGEQYGGIIF